MLPSAFITPLCSTLILENSKTGKQKGHTAETSSAVGEKGLRQTSLESHSSETDPSSEARADLIWKTIGLESCWSPASVCQRQDKRLFPGGVTSST